MASENLRVQKIRRTPRKPIGFVVEYRLDNGEYIPARQARPSEKDVFFTGTLSRSIIFERDKAIDFLVKVRIRAEELWPKRRITMRLRRIYLDLTSKGEPA